MKTVHAVRMRIPVLAGNNYVFYSLQRVNKFDSGKDRKGEFLMKKRRILVVALAALMMVGGLIVAAGCDLGCPGSPSRCNRNKGPYTRGDCGRTSCGAVYLSSLYTCDC